MGGVAVVALPRKRPAVAEHALLMDRLLIRLSTHSSALVVALGEWCAPSHDGGRLSSTCHGHALAIVAVEVLLILRDVVPGSLRRAAASDHGDCSNSQDAHLLLPK